VGIVVAAYNAEPFLQATLDSILSQSYGDWVAIVVDDGSDDRTLSIARQYTATDHRFRVLTQENAGPCEARNLGLADLPDGIEYVTFMDADDVWHSDALQVLVDRLDQSPGRVGAHGLADFIDAAGAPFEPGVFSAMGRARVGCRGGHPQAWPVDADTCFETVITASVMFPPGLLLARASAYRQIGGFDLGARYAEDWDALIRLSRIGPIAFVDKVILGYRRHDRNVGASSQVPKACARVRRRAYFSPDNDDAQRRIVRESWRACQIMDARERWSNASELIARGRFPAALRRLVGLPGVAARYVAGRPLPALEGVARARRSGGMPSWRAGSRRAR
jgi:glycosyltransferase involved in cell wall biosynthesis